MLGERVPQPAAHLGSFRLNYDGWIHDNCQRGEFGTLGVVAVEKSELRRVAGGFCEAEVAKGVRGEQTPARRALDEALLDQEGLDDLLDGVARLRQSGRDRLDPDRATTVVLG